MSVLQRLLFLQPCELLQLPILCGKSTPGGEGELLANELVACGDLSSRAARPTTVAAECTPDETLRDSIANGKIDLGADCITETSVVNKVGTLTLAQAAQESNGAACRVVCCSDRFKLWDDMFLPGLVEIFECIPKELLDAILVPPPAPAALN